MNIKIMHLFPDLLNLYGDKGNIECMRKRLEWRGIDCEVQVYDAQSGELDVSDVDIIFLGGGSDREQKIVSTALFEHREKLKEFAKNDGSIVATCGGFEMLGNYYMQKGEKIDGLRVLDIYTEEDEGRLVDNVIVETDFLPKPNNYVVGFENHSGRTNINNYKPLGRVLRGNGNSDKSEWEGVVYKNVIGTHLHGPLFPKNPNLCDYVLTNALKKKYSDFTELPKLDDEMENTANEFIVKRFS